MSRAATTRLKVNAPIGMRPSLENHRLQDLNVDPEYQRSIENGSSLTLIRKIAMFWDWSLFQPLSVARRPDGTLWVVDGQHRLAAARMRQDIWDLPCVVSAYATAGDEAASFVAMNAQRRPLSAIDLFKAAVVAQDASAVAIVKLIRDADLQLAPHSNYTAWKPGMIANIAGIQRCYRLFGERKTGRALSVLARAFDGHVLRYGGTIFGGIANLIGKAPPTFEDGLFVLILSGASQAEWMDDIQLEKASGGQRWDISGETVFAKAYAEATADEDVA